MHNFKQLKVWQKARELVKQIYLVTASFPKAEIYGLTAQIRRAAISIPANIAEGCGRNTDKDTAKFWGFAIASAYEVETELILASDLGFIGNDSLFEIVNEVQGIQKMLFKLIENTKG